MDKRTAAKALKVMLEVAREKVEAATDICGNIDSDSKWKAFDKACKEADSFVISALCCVPDGFLPEDEEKKLISSLKELQANRIEVFIGWQMKWRERLVSVINRAMTI